MGKITTKVMRDEFVPPKSGRRALVDIGVMQLEIREANGKWVQFYFSDSREANSALRQFIRVPGFEIVSEGLAEGGKNIFGRWVPDQT